jgi:hypothetical protein
MSNYIISNGELYNTDELMHYGVKGMKWGVTSKRDYRVAKKFAKVGRKRGAADYYKQVGDTAYKKHDENARVLDKTAKKLESKGSYIKAQLVRKSAEALRARGENIKRSNYEIADSYVNKALKLETKANKFATKKRVDLGKKVLDNVLNDSRAKGYESAARLQQTVKEYEMQSKLGSENYKRYNKLRGL